MTHDGSRAAHEFITLSVALSTYQKWLKYILILLQIIRPFIAWAKLSVRIRVESMFYIRIHLLDSRYQTFLGFIFQWSVPNDYRSILVAKSD